MTRKHHKRQDKEDEPEYDDPTAVLLSKAAAAQAGKSFCTFKNTLYIIILSGGLISICLAFAVLMTTEESKGGGMSNMGSNFAFLAMMIIGCLFFVVGSILWIVDSCRGTSDDPNSPAYLPHGHHHYANGSGNDAV